MGMSGPQIQSYNRNLGPQYGQSAAAYNSVGDVGGAVGSGTPFANRLIGELTNFLGDAGAISGALKSYYGQGPSLAQQQLTSQVGRDIQKRGEEAVGQIRENPYASGARSGADLLGQYLAPMETGLYSQQAQDAMNRQQLGLGALGQQMQIPGMYNAMLGPEQFKTGTQFGYDQLNSQIALQNVMNKLNAAGGLGNLAQLFAGSQELYMQPDFMGQLLQALLGGLAGGAGQAAGRAIPTAI